MKGHALVWHGATPSWVDALSPPELRIAFEDHIRTVAGHYRGRVHAWDVVNEVIDDAKPGLRSTVFSRGLGPEYVAVHLSAASFPAAADIRFNIQRLADLGLRVNISEMDVRVCDLSGDGAAKLERQRQVHHDVVAACVAAPVRGRDVLGLHRRPYLDRRGLRSRRPAALRRAVPGEARLIRRRGRSSGADVGASAAASGEHQRGGINPGREVRT